jgi:hypothetical protein
MKLNFAQKRGATAKKETKPES